MLGLVWKVPMRGIYRTGFRVYGFQGISSIKISSMQQIRFDSQLPVRLLLSYSLLYLSALELPDVMITADPHLSCNLCRYLYTVIDATAKMMKSILRQCRCRR